MAPFNIDVLLEKVFLDYVIIKCCCFQKQIVV